ncbi:MAG: hypothetical protein J0L93_09030 [Deltaproteobacteria bacterium]|nr:hypothetical protein [Deltaproteobacteria bacterium]
MQFYSIFITFIFLNIQVNGQVCQPETTALSALSVEKLKQSIIKEKLTHDVKGSNDADYLKSLRKISVLSSLKIESIQGKSESQLDEIALKDLNAQIQSEIENILGKTKGAEIVKQWRNSVTSDEQNEFIQEFKEESAVLNPQPSIKILNCRDSVAKTEWNFEINREKKEVRFTLKLGDKTYSSERFVKMYRGSLDEHTSKYESNVSEMMMFDIESGLPSPNIGRLVDIPEELKKIMAGENAKIFLAFNALTQQLYPKTKDKTILPLGISFQLEIRDQNTLSEFEKKLAAEHKFNTGRDLYVPDSFAFIRRLEMLGSYEEFMPREMAAEMFNEKDKNRRDSARKFATDKLIGGLQGLGPSLIMQCKEIK